MASADQDVRRADLGAGKQGKFAGFGRAVAGFGAAAREEDRVATAGHSVGFAGMAVDGAQTVHR